jgi:hypothetical protein
MKKLAYILFLILFLSVGQVTLAIEVNCDDVPVFCDNKVRTSHPGEDETVITNLITDCVSFYSRPTECTETIVEDQDGDTEEDEPEPTPVPTPASPTATTVPTPASPTATTAPKPTVGETVAESIAITDVEFTPNVPFGNFQKCTFSGQGGGTGGNNCLGLYINAWYGFALGTVGILATFMIMFAGFKYMTDPKSVADAKKIIVSAVTGLVLTFLIYTILNIVNPNLLVISMPNIPRLNVSAGMNLGGQTVNHNANETDGTTSSVNPLLPADMKTSQTDPQLTGREDLVNSGNALIDQLKQEGKLPPGFDITYGYSCSRPNSQHCAGNAFDVTWPGITQENAQAFVNNVIATNPEFSTIIETNGEYGSSWRQNGNSVGMGVHLDLRETVQHLE